MFKFLIPFISAVFLIFTPATADTPTTTPPVACETVESVLKDLQDLNFQGDTLVIKGEVLTRFNQNYSHRFNEPAPTGVSALLFAILDNGNWLMLVFGDDGCHAEGPIPVDPEIAQQLIYGRSADNT